MMVKVLICFYYVCYEYDHIPTVLSLPFTYKYYLYDVLYINTHGFMAPYCTRDIGYLIIDDDVHQLRKKKSIMLSAYVQLKNISECVLWMF